MSKWILVVMLVFCAGVVAGDDPVEYNESMGPIGDGDCFELRDIVWPDCIPPQACAYTQGVPQGVSPSLVQINGDWYRVPSWDYLCPSTARGRTDVASSIPSTMCIGTTDTGGKTHTTLSTFVCFTVTECDATAIASNTEHATVTAKKWKWIRDTNGSETLAEDNYNKGYWQDAGNISAKNSNCTGDSSHPLYSLPYGQISKDCTGTACPQ